MKQRLLNLLLIVTSLGGYLEWGGGNSAFLYEAEAQVLAKLISNPAGAAHPFTLLPLLGQVILLITLFQSRPGRLLTAVGLACVSLLLVFMFLIGVFSLNPKIIISTLPFVIAAVVVVMELKHR